MGEASALGAALSWAASSLIMKVATRQLSPLLLNSLRCLAAGLILWFIVLAVPEVRTLERLSWVVATYLILSAFLGLGLGDTLYIKSLSLENVSRSFTISMSLYPLANLVLAVLWLREPVTWEVALGTLITLWGVYWVAFPGKGLWMKTNGLTPGRRLGLLLAVAAPLCWAVAVSVLKLGLMEVDPLTAQAVRLLPTGLLLLVIAYPQGKGFHAAEPRWGALGLAVAAGILSYGLGGFLFLTALQMIGAAKSVILSSVSPLFLVPLAVFGLKEKVTVRLALGVVLCVVGIGLVV